MKRAINAKVDQLFEKLTSCLGTLNYRFKNLCIKAEEASLVAITVSIEGETKNLEDVSTVAKKDDYHFWIVPTYEEDTEEICKGIAKVHPEFKQRFDSMTVQAPSASNPTELTDQEMKYIELTMPEVNDDRYDVLKEATNLFYDECKTKMKVAIDKTWADVLFLAPGESKEDLEQLKNNIDKGKEMAEQQRDKMYNDKLKEIEDAYKEWLSKLDGRKNIGEAIKSEEE